MKPLVSVIVPMYNAEATIAETLASILASTYAQIEVLVMDDGSTDNSRAVAQRMTGQDSRIQVFTQPNAGVSAARNNAIRHAKGEWILPVDADDTISPTYIGHAVQAIRPEVRVISCRARMVGAKNEEWRLPKYSPALLARKNMIHISSFFRRIDWEQVGGFCEQDIYREDWDFWLSLMELGGEFVLLDEVGLYYRVQAGSRRSAAKQHKRIIVDAINSRHPDYLYRYLGGPLHYQRSWSRFFNRLRCVNTMPKNASFTIDTMAWGKGVRTGIQIMAEGRNTLVETKDGIVVKYFDVPVWWRKLLYLFSPSKARRSYRYALRLNKAAHTLGHPEPLTPEPVAFAEERYMGLLCHSAYACEKSMCSYSLQDIVFGRLTLTPEQAAAVYPAVGRTTAMLHRIGCLHRDYSPGNILFSLDGKHIQIVDLNRITWKRHISRDTGLLNFERLNLSEEALTNIASAYAEAMHYNRDYCVRYVLSHRWWKHRHATD